MTVRRRIVRVTANFNRNLDGIEAFLVDGGGDLVFDSLLRRLSEEMIPTLERFPEIGAEFLARAPLSDDGKALFAKVLELLGPETGARQFVSGDYIILYATRSDATYLLAIRHHRELSFDFTAHWP